MKFNVDFNDKTSFKKIRHEDEGVDFVEGFLEEKEFITESKIDYDVDDMLCYSLIRGINGVYVLIPDGECSIDVYKVLTEEAVQSIKETLDEFEED